MTRRDFLKLLAISLLSGCASVHRRPFVERKEEFLRIYERMSKLRRTEIY